MEQALTSDRTSGIVILDSQALRRAGLAGVLQDWARERHVPVIPAAPEEVNAAKQIDARPALAILSLGGVSLSDQTARGWLVSIVHSMPDTPIAIVSDLSTPEEVVAAFSTGARGYVPTTTEPEVALQAFAFIMRGGSYFPPQALLDVRSLNCRSLSGVPIQRRGRRHRGPEALTVRQAEVLEHLQAGRSNKLIARFMGTCKSTVKVHVRQLMKKLGTVNRTQAALIAYARGAVNKEGGDVLELANGTSRRIGLIVMKGEREGGPA